MNAPDLDGMKLPPYNIEAGRFRLVLSAYTNDKGQSFSNATPVVTAKGLPWLEHKMREGFGK